MKRGVVILAMLAAALRLWAQDDLPKKDGADEPFEVEPPLLIQNGVNEEVYATSQSPVPADVAQLEKKLESAKRSAISAQRLVKAGILAKVEAEARGLRVARITAELEEARLGQAKDQLVVRQRQFEAKEIAKNEVDSAVAGVKLATETALKAIAARDMAELDAAKLNLERQQKLLSLGSARKSDVARAEAKVAELSAKTSGRD